ncbi:MAG: recombinase family protein [Bacilli bacterium]
MESKIFGLARVSSKEQNEERQISILKEFGVQERDIYCDKISGSRECMESREQYNLLKKNLRKGDLLVLPSLDRLSRDYQILKNEWEYITKVIGADIVVLNMSLLDTRTNKDLMGTFISDLVIQILAFFSEKERKYSKERQRQGIDNALSKGIRFGRPRIAKPVAFDDYVMKWRRGEISAAQAMSELGLKESTFYKILKENN